MKTRKNKNYQDWLSQVVSVTNCWVGLCISFSDLTPTCWPLLVLLWGLLLSEQRSQIELVQEPKDPQSSCLQYLHHQERLKAKTQRDTQRDTHSLAEWEVQFSSVTQSCQTLSNPMNRSMPGLPVHHQVPEFTQAHVHWVGDAIQPSHIVIPFSSCLQSFPASGSFQMSQLFSSGGQSIGVLASASVLPMNTQDWSPLGWTSWISLQSKGLSRVFSNTTIQKHQFFGIQLSL